MGSYGFHTVDGQAHPLFVEYVGAGRVEELLDAQGREVLALTFLGRLCGRPTNLAVVVRVEEAAILINAIRIAAEDRGIWPAISAALDQIAATSRAEGWTLDRLRGPEGG